MRNFRALIFAAVAAFLTALASQVGAAAEGKPFGLSMSLCGALVAGAIAAFQVRTPSQYNQISSQGASFNSLSFTKKKSFGWGALINGALTAGVQIAASGGIKQALPLILGTVAAAATGGTAYINRPPDQASSKIRDTQW